MKRAAHVIVTPELAKKSESRSCGSRVVAEVHRAEPQDCELVVLLRARDERGFDLAYARYGQRIFGFLLRLTRSRGLAEDLFQHTFLRLAEHGASLRPDSDLKAWLFAVARNAFHSHARAQALAARLDPRAQYELRSLLPDWRLEASELEVALGRLAAGIARYCC